ncbi:MAG: hypothetical protein ABSF60_11005 [Verrucomicrobiota bacterium]
MILFECLIALTLVTVNLLVGSCLFMAGRADRQINQFDETAPLQPADR